MFTRISILLFLLLQSTFSLFSQSIYIELSGNYALFPPINRENALVGFAIPSEPYLHYLTYKIDEKLESKPGIDFNIGIKKELNNFFSVEAAIGITNVNFKRTIKITYPGIPSSTTDIPAPFISNGFSMREVFQSNFNTKPNQNTLLQSSTNSVIDNYDKLGNTNLFYLTTTIGGNVNLLPNRLSAGLLAIPGILIHSTEKVLSNRLTITDNCSNDHFKKTSFMASCNIQYRIIQRIWLKADFTYAFTPIYSTIEEKQAHPSILKLGLRYYW